MKRLAAMLAALPLAGAFSASAQVTAIPANDFLNTMGVDSHMDQGLEDLTDEQNMLQYLGIRHIRDGSISNTITLHNALGITSTFPCGNGTPNLANILASYRQLAAAGALMAIEGPNEPNNFAVTYNGQTSGSTYLPVAQFQRDLYQAVKADATLKNYPVFHTSEGGGAEADNVGLQFLTIPTGAGTLMPDGTVYADYANCHNYMVGPGQTHVVDNNTWGVEAPVNHEGGWDDCHGEYGVTWAHGYQGYTSAQLGSVPKVTTETGWGTQGNGSITEDQQGKLYLSVYLAAVKRGWSYTFIYEIHDFAPYNEYFGMYHGDFTPKLSANYIHNFTTILADTVSNPPGQLNYSIPNEPSTVHDLLLQKSSGAFYLAVWDDRPVGEGTDNVTVNIGGTASVVVFDPTIGTGAQQTLNNVSSVALSLTDHPVILEITNIGGLPPGWSDADIGAPGVHGYAAYSGGNWTVAGGGADIWGGNDQFNFASTPVSGDGFLITEVTSLTNTDGWAKSGLMYRDSIGAGSMFVDLVATQSSGIAMQWRNATNGGSGGVGLGGIAAPTPANPVWLKLVKTGSTYTGSYSANGSSWTQIGTVSVAFSNTSYLGGLAVTAHNNGLLNTSNFANVTVSSSVPASLAGLNGQYFNNLDFTGAELGEVDPNVNFNFGSGSPVLGIDSTSYSVRWIGFVVPQYSQTYTFTTTTDDGARLFVNGTQLINQWVDQAVTSVSGSIPLLAGQYYPIRMDYYQNGGGASAQLSWSSPGQTAQVIPQSNLLAVSGGLFGSYYTGTSLSGTPAFTEVDPTVNFNWGTSGPSSLVGQTHFSVRWKGSVLPDTTDTYHFYATADDGVRLWVNGQQLVNAWVDEAATQYSGTVALTAGQPVNIQMEYYQDTSSAAAQLAWSNSTLAQEIIPSLNLIPLPTWSGGDIGSIGIAGTSNMNPITGIYTLQGSGSDIWGTADAFQFFSQPLTGNGQIVARVTSVQNTDPWAKAGVMIRQSLDAGSAQALTAVTYGSGIAFQRRLTANGGSTHTAGPSATAPYWVKLVRSGSTFTSYCSPDGVTWTQVGSDTIAMSGQTFIGLALTAHNNGLLNTSTFDNVQVTALP